MGWTSENVASDFNITREEQDAFAAASFIKAEAAQRNKLFSKEIVPFTILQNDRSSGQRVPVLITEDDGIRYGTTQANLSKIKPAFPQWGNSTTTGGNASQITDGAAAILLMSRREAEKRGLRILAKHVTTAVVGNMIPFLPISKSTMFFFRCATTYYGCWPSICHPYGVKECRFAVR
jgi:acetyl-CoA acetyltransferase